MTVQQNYRTDCLLGLTLLLAASLPTSATEPLIETVAGTGQAENNGDVGSALKLNVGDPFGVEFGPDGALYICEVRNHRLRRLDLATGQISTVAGTGRQGYSGDGGPATAADLNEPYEIRFDKAGNLYVVEMRNHIVRRIDASTGKISTVAGTGMQGFGGDGGLAVKATLSQPHSIALDGYGNLYIADIGNHRIRRVDLQTGVIDTIAGNGQRALPREKQTALGNPLLGPRALFIDGDTMWIALREGHSVWRMNNNDGALHHVAGRGQRGFSGDGGSASQATFDGPKGIAIGPDKNLYVVDTENHAIRKIDTASGTITTIAGRGPTHPGGDGDSGPATKARMNRPHGICVAADGGIYIGDTLNHRVRRIK
jgi:DNA-binding beta-propeller fold protein YncE